MQSQRAAKNALIGAVVSIVTGFLPFVSFVAPLLGGGVAGYTQRAGLRDAEPLPSDPAAVIDHVASASDIDSATEELADLLIENARAADHPVDEEAALWGLAALRRASQLTDGNIKLKTLSKYTDEDSTEISTRAKQLRSVMSQAELNSFRTEHAL
jgi:transcription initiation factor TFIIB